MGKGGERRAPHRRRAPVDSTARLFRSNMLFGGRDGKTEVIVQRLDSGCVDCAGTVPMLQGADFDQHGFATASPRDSTLASGRRSGTATVVRGRPDGHSRTGWLGSLRHSVNAQHACRSFDWRRYHREAAQWPFGEGYRPRGRLAFRGYRVGARLGQWRIHFSQSPSITATALADSGTTTGCSGERQSLRY